MLNTGLVVVPGVFWKFITYSLKIIQRMAKCFFPLAFFYAVVASHGGKGCRDEYKID